MKVLLSWIKELIGYSLDIPYNKIIDILEQLGYEIEYVKKHDLKLLSNIKVVKILNIEKHPNADKLFLCDVTDSVEKYKVVCGADNIYVGMIAPYAGVGSFVTDGNKIEVRKIRGVESYGMLCSPKELGMSDDHSGILELDESFKLGDTLNNYFDDVIVEIKTPLNRYDCLGHLGIAKEVAIKLGLDFRDKNRSISNIESKTLPFFDIKVTSNQLCKRYIAINIKSIDNNVKLPFFIYYRLLLSGIKKINPVVDISNYVMLEIGHSVHIFDYDKLVGGKIIVRVANESEYIDALDGKNYKLDNSIIVIADEEKPVAIAGIIGGQNSCVDENTKNIVIESAVFNRSMIRLTRKKLGINTQASLRFEKGSSFLLCEIAALKTQQLILKYCKGETAKFTDYKDMDYYKNLTSLKSNGITVDLNFISSLLGINIQTAEFIDLIRKLDAEVIFNKDIDNIKNFIILPPINRQDIKFQADIAEEIARFIGYDRIPETLPKVVSSYVERNKIDLIKNKVINFLLSCGLNQAINYSLCSSKDNEFVFENDFKKISVLNPVSNEYNELRLSLLSGLIKSLFLNINNQQEDIAFFEIGKIYYKKNEDKIVEEEIVGIITYGSIDLVSWKKNILNYDFYFINGLLENLFKFLRIDYIKIFNFKDLNISKPLLKEEIIKNFVGYLTKDKIPIGFSCELDKDFLKFKLNKPIFYAEVYLDILENLYNDLRIYQRITKYPFLLRDLCLKLPDENFSYLEIINIIKNFINNNFNNIDLTIRLIDYYKKGDDLYLTLSIKIRDFTKTLTDKEANEIINSVILELKNYNIDLRRE